MFLKGLILLLAFISMEAAACFTFRTDKKLELNDFLEKSSSIYLVKAIDIKATKKKKFDYTKNVSKRVQQQLKSKLGVLKGESASKAIIRFEVLKTLKGNPKNEITLHDLDVSEDRENLSFYIENKYSVDCENEDPSYIRNEKIVLFFEKRYVSEYNEKEAKTIETSFERLIKAYPFGKKIVQSIWGEDDVGAKYHSHFLKLIGSGK